MPKTNRKMTRVLIDSDFRTKLKIEKRAKKLGVSLDAYISNWIESLVQAQESPEGADRI